MGMGGKGREAYPQRPGRKADAPEPNAGWTTL